MKRRLFVKNSLLIGTLAGIAPMITKAANKELNKAEDREFYELRVYSLKDATQQKLVEDYLQNAAIPALNKIGSKNIGVFTEVKPEGQTKIYVLIAYATIDDFLQANEKLSKDGTYMKAANAYLDAPATAPAYERIEKSLLHGFKGFPKIVTPPKKERIFELRRYESPSEAAAKKKIEMFNDAGELAIFKRTGLRGVFFGESLTGEQLPNLTYMLTYNDMAEHDQVWKTFIADPEWKKVSGMPEYADAKIISKITAIFLQPAEFSQV